LFIRAFITQPKPGDALAEQAGYRLVTTPGADAAEAVDDDVALELGNGASTE
jgi:hypothetical protein